jgi:hypothetical protein
MYHKILRTTVLALLLMGAAAASAAEKNIFKDLPGVNAPKGFSAESTERPDCTSQVVSPYYHGRRELPVRMYSCKNGLVTYESTVSPSLSPPAGDPYVHGENLTGLPGVPN